MLNRKKILGIGLCGILSCTGVLAIFKNPETSGKAFASESHEIINNVLDNMDDKTVIKLSKQIMNDRSGKKIYYRFNTEKKYKDAVEALDITDRDYSSQLYKIMKNTDPSVYQKTADDQIKDLAKAEGEIQYRQPDQIYKSIKEDGSIEDNVEIYNLQSGAKIIVSGIDEEDNTADKMIAPAGTLHKLKWITNKGIKKERGKRRYTAKYSFLINGTSYGHMSVTTHYTITEDALKYRQGNIWSYDSRTPISIKVFKNAYQYTNPDENIKSQADAKDEKIATGAQYYVTFTKKTETSVGEGVEASFDESATYTWEKNQTSLHKIYSIVKLKKMESDGAKVTEYGQVFFYR